MLFHLRRHSDIWSICQDFPPKSLLYQIVVSLNKPMANTKGLSLCVMLPKSNANARTGTLSLIARKVVSVIFPSLPTSVKLLRHTSEEQDCHVAATLGVCVHTYHQNAHDSQWKQWIYEDQINEMHNLNESINLLTVRKAKNWVPSWVRSVPLSSTGLAPGTTLAWW